MMTTRSTRSAAELSKPRGRTLIRAAAMLGLGALIVTTGCETGRGLAGKTATAGIPLHVAGLAMVGMHAALTEGGPRVTFENATCRKFTIRYWVGKVDVTKPGGVTEIKTSEDLYFAVAPHKTEWRRTGRAPWPTGVSDALIRAEIHEQLADGSEGEVTWWEFSRPSPYYLRVREEECGKLVWDRPLGGGTLTEVAEIDRPVGRNGNFPVYASGAMPLASGG